jgi:Fe-S-cluster containining protein
MESDVLKNWQSKSLEKQTKFKQFLKNSDQKKLLKQLPQAPEQAFESVDCLTCANCCKNYSPRFKPPDVKRIAKYLKMSESELKDTYLRRDEDGDFVVKQSPCPFLDSDNYCSIYEARPSDCHRFPYTDEDVLLKKQQITLKNSTFCPAVYLVLEKLMAV